MELYEQVEMVGQLSELAELIGKGLWDKAEQLAGQIYNRLARECAK